MGGTTVRRSFLGILGGGLALALAGCVHLSTRHDYAVSVRGILVDGEEDQPVEGLHVIVKAGDTVIYDGFTDSAGNLSFTYERSREHRRRSQGKGAGREPITVLLQVKAGDFGVVEVPLTLGDRTEKVTLGEIQLRPIEGQ